MCLACQPTRCDPTACVFSGSLFYMLQYTESLYSPHSVSTFTLKTCQQPSGNLHSLEKNVYSPPSQQVVASWGCCTKNFPCVCFAFPVWFASVCTCLQTLTIYSLNALQTGDWEWLPSMLKLVQLLFQGDWSLFQVGLLHANQALGLHEWGDRSQHVTCRRLVTSWGVP